MGVSVDWDRACFTMDEVINLFFVDACFGDSLKLFCRFTFEVAMPLQKIFWIKNGYFTVFYATLNR